MARYHCILIDLDNTLLDFEAAEAAALATTLGHFNLPAGEEATTRYHEINAGLWAQFEKGEVRKEQLQVQRFAKLLAVLGKQGNPAQINDYYLAQLAQNGQILPGADEFLRDVEDYVTIGIVTNGMQKAQAGRLAASGIGEFADGVFISEKLGVAKPDKRFVNIALDKLGITNRSRVLVIGDSISADIRCGQAAGLDTCWFNFKGLAQDDGGSGPTYTVRGFEELKTVILEQEELDHVGEKKRHSV